ncbi:MAG TPA: C45 family peptidase [Acidimicrobiia bacterium]
MHTGALRVVELAGSPGDLGRGHAEACGELIRRYVDERLERATDQRWSGGGSVDRDFILGLADSTLPAHEAYSPDLYEEMVGMSHAAGITPAEAVVVGGFTDMVDVIRARVGESATEDNCTAVLDPADGVLAQTWDMHKSAEEYVYVFRMHPDRGPAAIVFTTAGCLGQIGMNEAGIAIGINNLTSWGKSGVTWPFVVRKALAQSDFDAAVEAVTSADLAGGHNFLVLGPGGRGVNVEAMPGNKVVTTVTGSPFVHTNHCLAPETASEEAPRLQESVVSSDIRLKLGVDLARDLEDFFARPEIARHANAPEETATCGAVIMEPGRRSMRAVWGVPGSAPWETLTL